MKPCEYLRQCIARDIECVYHRSYRCIIANGFDADKNKRIEESKRDLVEPPLEIKLQMEMGGI
jgi:hypothetical protein